MKLVGTGPFIDLTEYVHGQRFFNFVRNPNYWDYDAQNHPENRLPVR